MQCHHQELDDLRPEHDHSPAEDLLFVLITIGSQCFLDLLALK